MLEMKGTTMHFIAAPDDGQGASQPSRISEAFGNLLRHAREQAGYRSPHELSGALKDQCSLDVNERSIYRYENGESSPTVPILLGISVVLTPQIYVVLLRKIYGTRGVEALRMISNVIDRKAKMVTEQATLFDLEEFVSGD